MTRILGVTLRVPGWVKGLIQDMDAENAPLGSYTSASNLVPLPAGRLGVRGGSRLVRTLKDDQGTPAEWSHFCRLQSFSPVGMVAVGWSDTQNKHYATRLTSDGAFFTGVEATSRTDLTAAPSTDWNNTTAPARPMMAELWEKLFLIDATATYADRNTFLSFDSSGVVLEPHFNFGGGAAAMRPFCLETYNNVLFVAGYDDAAAEPALVRHSFLGRSPDDVTASAEGFDTNAFNIIGAEGQAVTAMKAGNNILLIAKTNELYRVSGFGRAYPGWQYQVERVTQTQGLGVVNPFALEFAEGYWYGIGAQGPFRTDGFTVEPLRGPRDTAWSLTSNPEAQFVEYHPDRGLILFGVRQATGLPAGLYLAAGGTTPATYPNVLWTWDVQRGVYGPDWGFGLSFFHVRAVGSTTVQTPQGAPIATAASSITTTGFTENWTNGDATCQTERYEKVSGGTYSLHGTEAAAATSKVRTGLLSHTTYLYKMTHIKSGIRSTDSNEITVQTLLATPTVVAITGLIEDSSPSGLTVTLVDSGVTLYAQVSADGVSGWSTAFSVSSLSAGDYTYLMDTVLEGYFYRFYTEDLAWSPTVSANSSVVQVPFRA